jgi:hypothetical protein
MKQETDFPSPEELLAQYRAGAAEQEAAGRREVLRIDVTLTGHTLEEPEPGYTILTLPFVGFADGPWFRGEVLPGASDVQRRRGGQIERFCADYWLEGRDFTGAPCRVHIVNVDEGAGWKPTVTTDSAALAFLNGADCRTVMEMRRVGPIVHIYAELPPSGGAHS